MECRTVKLFFFLFALFCSTNIFAYSILVDGIYYNILSKSDKTVSVTYRNTSYGSYSGKVSIPSTVTIDDVTYRVETIGPRAFFNCRELVSVTLPATIIKIEDEAFYFCSSVKNINIPSSVSSIGDDAFYYCTSLESVELSESLKSIGDAAFRYCSKITSLTIPSGLTYIGNNAFSDCSSLVSLDVQEGNKYYDSRDDCNALILTRNNTLILGTGGTNFIPSSVTTIGEMAFYDMTTLHSVTIPSTVTSIESSAFAGCTNLTDVVIPSSVKYIGDRVFENCTRLKSVTLPNSITEMPDELFWNCSSLETLVVPNSVKKIGQSCFFNCTGLKSVVIPESVENISNYAFGNCSSLENLEIQAGNTVIPWQLSMFYAVRMSQITLKVIGENAPYYALDSNWGNFNNLLINGYIPGDANNDNTLTVADITAISDYVIGTIPVHFNRDAADINWNGKIDITDLTTVINRIKKTTNNW